MVRKLVLSCATLLLALLAAELVVRFVQPQAASWLAIYRTHPELPIYAVDVDLDNFVDTGESAWTIYSDGEGHRSAAPESRRRAPAGGRVLVMGDSFTFGNGVDHEQTFVGLLDAAGGGEPAFMNCGVPGYGPRQYLMLLEHRFADGPLPRAVLLAPYLGNDFQDTLWDKPVDPHAGKTTGRVRLRDHVKRNSHFYRLASKAWHRLRPSRQDRVARELFSIAAWKEPFLSRAGVHFGETMAAIVELCSSHAVPLTICILPPEHTVRDEASADPNHDPALPVTRARALLAGLEVEVLDPTTALRAVGADRAFWPLDGHLTPAGHSAVADALAPLLATLGLGGGAAQSSPPR
ncbi:MAG: hypothetical protein CMJ84_03120 [Planctomycetes bacterium]|jgi:hypothetical protein|nr:hypothetical protein [Planctomycetota bacterium]MDP6410720.1 hypothetical protein [Planctomycetota bacterium]